MDVFWRLLGSLSKHDELLGIPGRMVKIARWSKSAHIVCGGLKAFLGGSNSSLCLTVSRRVNKYLLRVA